MATKVRYMVVDQSGTRQVEDSSVPNSRVFWEDLEEVVAFCESRNASSPYNTPAECLVPVQVFVGDWNY